MNLRMDFCIALSYDDDTLRREKSERRDGAIRFDLSDFLEFPPRQDGRTQPMLSLNNKGHLAMNRAFRQKLGETREFHGYFRKTGYQILLFPDGEPNICFSKAGGVATNRQLAASLQTMGNQFPVRYHFQWDEENRAWVGACQEMAEPPRVLRGYKPGRRRKPA